MLNDYASRSSYYADQTLFGNLTQGFVSANDFHAAGCITDWNDPGHVQYWRLCGADGDAGLRISTQITGWFHSSAYI